MRRTLSCWRRASSSISPAISGSSASTCGMGGRCIRRDLLVRKRLSTCWHRRESRLPPRRTGRVARGRSVRSTITVRPRRRAPASSLTATPASTTRCDRLRPPPRSNWPASPRSPERRLAKTTANALAVAAFVGPCDVPVTPGCAGRCSGRRWTPITCTASRARRRGAAGAAAARGEEHATDFIIDTLAAARGEITLVATGPLTNIGLALRREPRLATWVRDFVIMGDPPARSQSPPAAEFNIWADPEAAAIVFGAGLAGADDRARRHAAAPGPPAAVQERMGWLGCARLDAAAARARAVPGLGRRNGGRRPVHDVCAIVLDRRPRRSSSYAPAQVAGGDARRAHVGA